jgi:PAS domain S-box-containing protein
MRADLFLYFEAFNLALQFIDLFELSDEIIFVTNSDDSFEHQNSKFKDCFKAVSSLRDLVDPEDYSRYYPLSSTSDVQKLTLRLRKKNSEFQSYEFKIKYSEPGRKYIYCGRELKISNEEIYKAALDHLPFGVSIRDAHQNMKLIYINDVALAMIGKTKEKVTELDSKSEKMTEDLRELDESCVKSDSAIDLPELEIQSEKNGLIYLRTQKKPILKVNSRARYVLTSAEDVTERKSIRENLLESEKTFRDLFENAPIPMLISDESRRTLDANKAYLDLFGYSLEELRQMQPFELTHPDDRAVSQKGSTDIVDKGDRLMRFQKRMISKDQRILHVKVSISPLKKFAGQKHWLLILEDVTESFDRKNKINEQSRFFEAIADSIPGMIHVLEKKPNEKPRTLYASSGSNILYGVTPEEIINGGLILFEMIHSEDRAGWLAKVEEASLNLGTHRFEFRFKDRSGVEKWALTHFTVNRTDDGTTLFNTIHIDITESKEKEKRLKMYEEILANTPDLVSCRTIDGHQFYRNRAYNQAFVAANESTNLEMVYPPVAFERLMKVAFPHALEFGFWSGETVILTKEQKLIPVSQMIICHKNRNNEPIYFSTVMRDISDIKSVHLELRQVIDAVKKSAIVTVLDDQENIIEANENFFLATGYSAQEVVGKPHQNFTKSVQSEEFTDSIWSKVRSGQIWQGETQYICKDGASIFMQSVISPIFNDENKIKFYMAIRFNITELKEMHQRLIFSSKMSSLGEMAGGIAHEINNPLAIISGKATQLIRLLGEEKFDHSVLIKHSETIDRTAHRIAEIVKGLKSFSRDAENDPFNMVTLNSIIEETLAFCQARFASHNTFLTIGDYDRRLFLECRSAQISQAVLNLLNNSFDAVQTLSDKWVRLEVRDLGEIIEISITDSGLGIPKNVQDKMMMPFFTTKEVGKGTGLGLSIVSGIIKAHHGTIEIDQRSQNTKFVLKFPKNQKRQQVAG